MVGVILAGGEGTRLGPLGLQRSKALVSVGGRPILVHQYRQLRRAGCDRIIVVVSPRTSHQVRQVAECAGLRIDTVVQHAPGGPPTGIIAALAHVHDTTVTVMFADTYIGTDAELFNEYGVGVGYAAKSRSFCHYDGAEWVDGPTPRDANVFIGYLRAPVVELEHACWSTHDQSGMADVLNALQLPELFVPSWRDAGDIEALTELNRHVFISRSFNDLQLTDRGLIKKSGQVREEVKFLSDVEVLGQHGPRHLYPRVFASDLDAVTPWYEMEHIPLPTLAELYIYWPREEGMWRHITTTLLKGLDRWHWGGSCALTGRAHAHYVDGMFARYSNPSTWPEPLKRGGKSLEVNGRVIHGGLSVVERAARVGALLASRASGGIVHGDPNFTNVLWSLETSSFKLVDPRGAWGGDGGIGDVLYDVGKIAYSPIFSRIAHGLFEVKCDLDTWEIPEWHDMLDPVINECCHAYTSPEQLLRVVAWLLISGAPLHQGDEASAMFLTGADLLESIT